MNKHPDKKSQNLEIDSLPQEPTNNGGGEKNYQSKSWNYVCPNHEEDVLIRTDGSKLTRESFPECMMCHGPWPDCLDGCSMYGFGHCLKKARESKEEPEHIGIYYASINWASSGKDEDYTFGYTEEELENALERNKL